jgi:hypothetical protein
MPNIGVYETNYGSAAVVNMSRRKAWDLNKAQAIPIELVTLKFIRHAEARDMKILCDIGGVM